MSKTPTLPTIAWPVPADSVATRDIAFLVVYYGAPGFTPSDDAKVEIPIGEVSRGTKDGREYYLFSSQRIVAQGVELDETVAFRAALRDDVGWEPEPSVEIAVPLDVVPPPVLEAPEIWS